MAVAGVGALTVGVNLLPPPGSRPFSVGDTDGAVVVVVVVVVVVDGDSVVLPPQAESAPIATNATAPTPAETLRRVIRCDFIMRSNPSP
jgi:hypothetical protein